MKQTMYVHTYSTLASLASILGSLEEDKSLLEEVNEKDYSIKDTTRIQSQPLKYRTINYWDSIGLLTDYRDAESREWRKFSMIDMAFIAIINKLKDFGFTDDKMQVVKDYLNMPIGVISSIPKAKQPSILKNLIFLGWAYFWAAYPLANDNVFLIIEPDGHSMLLGGRDISLNISEGNLPDSYISINLNQIFAGLLGAELVPDWGKGQPVLTEAEKTITRMTELLREGYYQFNPPPGLIRVRAENHKSF